jgi:hypothetical protein
MSDETFLQQRPLHTDATYSVDKLPCRTYDDVKWSKLQIAHQCQRDGYPQQQIDMMCHSLAQRYLAASAAARKKADELYETQLRAETNEKVREQREQQERARLQSVRDSEEKRAQQYQPVTTTSVEEELDQRRILVDVGYMANAVFGGLDARYVKGTAVKAWLERLYREMDQRYGHGAMRGARPDQCHDLRPVKQQTHHVCDCMCPCAARNELRERLTRRDRDGKIRYPANGSEAYVELMADRMSPSGHGGLLDMMLIARPPPNNHQTVEVFLYHDGCVYTRVSEGVLYDVDGIKRDLEAGGPTFSYAQYVLYKRAARFGPPDGSTFACAARRGASPSR